MTMTFSTRGFETPAEVARVASLAESLARNRFMPVPDELTVGDGDFRAIGAEFLTYFVEIGNLTPRDRVLDVGCGSGRMAQPLTQYLDPDVASYEGLDPVLSNIEWCVRTITTLYPRFHFMRVDVRNELYNKTGTMKGEEVVFPFRDEAFDFVAMVSVATHMTAPEVEAYLNEISRVLAPGGRLFLTAFVVRPADAKKSCGALRFKPVGQGTWCGNEGHPLAAVGFDEGVLDKLIAASGLTLRRKKLGHWRGARSAHFQDFFVAEKHRALP